MEIIDYKAGLANPALERIRSRAMQVNPELTARVAEIVDGVRAGGDEALVHYTGKFDGVTLRVEELRVDPGFIRDAASRARPAAVEAFRKAIEN
ncbi:MAG TPA: histidinol dehydrogenase, partial [Blastocatellia bacterium]|nr:histidinol dehydrogenase [Blastocatellia bacterium]